MVQELKILDEFDNCIKDNKLVVVDFTATWCPPCQRIKPVFHALPNEFPEITFVQVDVDENADAAGKAGVQCMPTFKFYKDGAEVDKLEGASEEQLRAKSNALKN